MICGFNEGLVARTPPARKVCRMAGLETKRAKLQNWQLKVRLQWHLFYCNPAAPPPLCRRALASFCLTLYPFAAPAPIPTPSPQAPAQLCYETLSTLHVVAKVWLPAWLVPGSGGGPKGARRRGQGRGMRVLWNAKRLGLRGGGSGGGDSGCKSLTDINFALHVSRTTYSFRCHQITARIGQIKVHFKKSGGFLCILGYWITFIILFVNIISFNAIHINILEL